MLAPAALAQLGPHQILEAAEQFLGEHCIGDAFIAPIHRHRDQRLVVVGESISSAASGVPRGPSAQSQPRRFPAWLWQAARAARPARKAETTDDCGAAGGCDDVPPPAAGCVLESAAAVRAGRLLRDQRFARARAERK